MARDMKFRRYRGSRGIVLSKALIDQLRRSAAFVFAYAKIRFSHDMAQISLNKTVLSMDNGRLGLKRLLAAPTSH